MGFGLTAMLTVLYSYVTGLGGAVAGIIVLFLLTLLKKLLQTTSKLSMISISIVVSSLRLFTSEQPEKVTVTAPSTPSESEEIEDDNSNYKLTKKILIKLTNVA